MILGAGWYYFCFPLRENSTCVLTVDSWCTLSANVFYGTWTWAEEVVPRAKSSMYIV